MLLCKFSDCLAFTWRPENDGQAFHNEGDDPGGATCWGVTLSTFRAWRLLRGMPDPSLSAFIGADAHELRSLYHTLFWAPLQCDALPPGVDLCVFDFAVMSNCVRAAEFLQRCVGVGDDGHIGPITLAAVAGHRPVDLINALTERDERFYATLTNFRVFGHGWDRRAEDRRRVALTMAGAPAPAPATTETG